VIVLDAFAVLAFLKGEPASEEVAQLLMGEESSSLTAVGLAEVMDHLVRLAGADEDEAALDVAQLDLAEVRSINAQLALRAGVLRARHYHRVRRAVSLADCIAAEVARAGAGALATTDPHLLDLCHEEGIRIVPLQDSQGQRWSR
jgi:PIN domain nuclease of toxin-antitoxin system